MAVFKKLGSCSSDSSGLKDGKPLRVGVKVAKGTAGDASGCCAGAKDACAPPSPVTTAAADWRYVDYLGALRCRLGAYRTRYAVAPGLYAIGAPGRNSDVFVSANYKLSFDILRSALRGVDAWILVLDTKGINVWCAAGKGTFETGELIGRIKAARLSELVSHKRIILPQLGAPGVAGHTVQKETGFRVCWGPVDARDIRAFIDAGYKATRRMRTIEFNLFDRLKLTPMEILPALKKYPYYALFFLSVFALRPSGASFAAALTSAAPFLILGAVSVFSGAFATPLLLPYIPNRSFAIKGWISGFITTLAASWFTGIFHMHAALIALTFLLYPLLSSYIALQFTGSTTFTGITGVKKELKAALPIYLSGVGASVILLAGYKLIEWGLI